MPGYVTYLDTVTRHGAPLTVRSYENGRGAQVFVRGECIGSIDNPGFFGFLHRPRVRFARCTARLRPPVCAAWTARTGAATRSASRVAGWMRGSRRARAADCSCPPRLRMPTVPWNAGT
jgi:hypothetical protein